MVERVLVVHTHPGDETVFTGSTIATLNDRGAEVVVLTVVSGADPATLERALAELGGAEHRLLGQPGARRADRAPRVYLASPGNRHPDSLAESSPSGLVDDLVATIVDVRPSTVVAWGDHDGLADPDRGRVHDALVEATAVTGVALHVRSSTGPVRVEPAVERRTRALAVLGLPADSTPGTEVYRRFRTRSAGFSSQPIGGRILTVLLALVVGALIGVTLTFVHQSTVTVGSAVIPWGIIAAVIIVTALFLGLRLVFDSRIVAVSAAIGVLMASALLALPNARGTVLVPATTLGYVWTFAPAVIAGLVLAWPRITQQAAGRINTPPLPKGLELP